MNARELKQKLKDYFGDTPNNVIFVRRRKTQAVYVEYEDFKSEPRVEAELSCLIGSGVAVTVKRECSEEMMRRIERMLRGNPDDLRMHLVETVECQRTASRC